MPAVRARLAGATNVIVDADPGFPPVHSHSGIKQSPGALCELRLAIGDAPPTCQMVLASAARAFSGAVIATAEDPASVLTP